MLIVWLATSPKLIKSWVVMIFDLIIRTSESLTLGSLWVLNACMVLTTAVLSQPLGR